MRIRAVLILTFAILFAVIGLIFHCLAVFTERWTITIPNQPRGPNDQNHYYGLWTRCQYSNTSFVMPDISSQPNIENFVCRPNTYVRYDIFSKEASQKCYSSRHQCSSIVDVPSDCKCKYLSVTKLQQWLSILAAIFILLAICVLYLKLIASPQNASAAFLLTFSPMILLSSALLLMITTMILVGAFLRHNEYEDYDIKLPKHIFQFLPMVPDTFNLYRLNAFFKNHKDPDLYQQVLSTFRSIHKERFYARIDWSAGAEIIAIVLTFIAHIFSIILAFAQLN